MNGNTDTSATVVEEQSGKLSEASRLCVQCGLCCGGALGEHARVLDGDEFNYTDAWGVTKGRNGAEFPLPCSYLQNKVCLIYSCRPKICVKWKCRLLMRFENGRILFAEAMGIIRQTVEHAARVRAALEAAVNEKNASLLHLYLRLKASTPISPDNAGIFLEFAALRVRLDKHFRRKAELYESLLTADVPDAGIENE